FTAAGNPRIVSVGRDFEGNIIAAGTISGEDFETQIWVSKWNSGGVLLWSRMYGDDQNDDYVRDMAVSGNNIYICGLQRSIPQGPGDEDSVVQLMKISSSGDVVWLKGRKSSDNDDVAAMSYRTSIAL